MELDSVSVAVMFPVDQLKRPLERGLPLRNVRLDRYGLTDCTSAYAYHLAFKKLQSFDDSVTTYLSRGSSVASAAKDTNPLAALYGRHVATGGQY